MKTIWKYKLIPNLTNMIPIDMPKGSEVLTVQTQGEDACLWALVDPDENKTTRVFEVYGTGHEMLPYPKQYVGTFQISGGALIFHVFERLL